MKSAELKMQNGTKPGTEQRTTDFTDITDRKGGIDLEILRDRQFLLPRNTRNSAKTSGDCWPRKCAEIAKLKERLNLTQRREQRTERAREQLTWTSVS